MTNAGAKVNVTDPRMRKPWRLWGRAVLILLLLLLLAVSWKLYEKIPRADLGAKFNGRRPSVYWDHPQLNASKIYSGNPFQNFDEPIELMNVVTGAITNATRADLFWHDGVNSRGERVALGSIPTLNQRGPKPPAERRCAYFKNVATGETRNIEFDLPGEDLSITNSRYVVSRDKDRIYAVDLEDDQPQAFSIVSPYIGTNLSTTPIFGTEFLYEIHPPSQSNSIRHRWDFLKIVDHQIQLVKSLEFGSAYGVAKFDDQLLTLRSDGSSVDVRSLDDLEIVDSIKVSEPFLASNDVIELFSNLIIGRDKQTSELVYYDVFGREQLTLPPLSRLMYRWDSKNARYRFLADDSSRFGRRTYVYDLKERRVCLTVPYSDEISMLDDGRFAITYPSYGVCTLVYDLETGKSIRHAPYQWYALAVAITLLAWFGWWIVWLIVSARDGGWVWDDLALIFGITPTILQFLEIGESEQTFAVLHGAFIGLLCFSVVYSVFACERRSIAFILPTLVFAAMFLWLSSLPTRFSPTYVRVCCTALLTISCFAIACVVVRNFGWCIKTFELEEHDSLRINAPVSILDLLSLIACWCLQRALPVSAL